MGLFAGNSSIKRLASHDRASSENSASSSGPPTSGHEPQEQSAKSQADPSTYSNPKVNLGGQSKTPLVVMAASAGGLIAISSAGFAYFAWRKNKS